MKSEAYHYMMFKEIYCTERGTKNTFENEKLGNGQERGGPYLIQTSKLSYHFSNHFCVKKV